MEKKKEKKEKKKEEEEAKFKVLNLTFSMDLWIFVWKL